MSAKRLIACLAVLVVGLSYGAPALAVEANSVTSAAIVNGAVATVDMANWAITTAKIAPGAVTNAKIALGAVTSAKILDGSVRASDIANGAINSAKIADGSITNADIAAGAAIAAAKIAGTAWTSLNVAPGFADGVDNDTQYLAGANLRLGSGTFDVVGGAGSGLDADLLDGLTSGAFASAGHEHDARYFTQIAADGRFVNNDGGEVDDADIVDGALSAAKIAGTAWTSQNDGAGSGLDADLLDGLTSTAFAIAGHNHDSSYAPLSHTHSATEVVSGTLDAARLPAGGYDSTYVNVGGDTMAGTLTAPDFSYSSARTGYYAIPVTALRPRSSAYTYSMTGPYLYATGASAETFVAPVFLPHGATITGLGYRVWDENATYDSSARLKTISGTSEGWVAQVDTVGSLGNWQWLSTTTNATVDNTSSGYMVEVTLHGAADFSLSAGFLRITYTYTSPGG